MNRAFSQREKVLLLVLTALVLAVGYMKLFYEPLQIERTEQEQRLAAAQDSLLIEQTRLARMRAMEAELEEWEASGANQDAELPLYDNVENVMIQLDAILSAAREYSLTFDQAQFGEDLVSRPVQMTFTAGGYAAARSILNDLYHCWYRCALSDISISAEEDIARESEVAVTLTVVFYEKYA